MVFDEGAARLPSLSAEGEDMTFAIRPAVIRFLTTHPVIWTFPSWTIDKHYGSCYQHPGNPRTKRVCGCCRAHPKPGSGPRFGWTKDKCCCEWCCAAWALSAVSKAIEAAVKGNAHEQPRHLTKEQTKEQRDKRSAEIQRRNERLRGGASPRSNTEKVRLETEREKERSEGQAMAGEDYDYVSVDMGGYNAQVCRPRDPAVAAAVKSLGLPQRGGTTDRWSTNDTCSEGDMARSRDRGHTAMSHTGPYACLAGTHFVEVQRMLMQGNQRFSDQPDLPDDCDEEQEERRRRLREHKAAEAMSHNEG